MKVLIRYRSNDLFDRYVPEVVEMLPQGVEVDLRVYPRGEPVPSIDEELLALLREEETVIVSDWTSSVWNKKSWAMGERPESIWEWGETEKNLDQIFQDAAEEILGGESFSRSLGRLVGMAHPSPSMIVVVENKIPHHLEGDEFPQLTRSMDREDQATSELVAGLISECLGEIFPEALVKICPDLDSALVRYGGQRDTVLVVDRHCDPPARARGCVVCVLPLESGIARLIKGGLGDLGFDTGRLYQKIFGELPIG